jgi:hypothetical protein
MSNPYKLKPGDTLVAARTDGTLYAGQWTIRSVGRKWAVIDSPRSRRVDLETLEIDGGGYSSPGRCYLSPEHYEREMQRLALWKQLREYVNTFNPPPSMTLERLEGILGALRGEK